MKIVRLFGVIVFIFGSVLLLTGVLVASVSGWFIIAGLVLMLFGAIMIRPEVILWLLFEVILGSVLS